MVAVFMAAWLVALVQAAALTYDLCDLDGDGCITREEFQEVRPVLPQEGASDRRSDTPPTSTGAALRARIASLARELRGHEEALRALEDAAEAPGRLEGDAAEVGSKDTSDCAGPPPGTTDAAVEGTPRDVHDVEPRLLGRSRGSREDKRHRARHIRLGDEDDEEDRRGRARHTRFGDEEDQEEPFAPHDEEHYEVSSSKPRHLAETDHEGVETNTSAASAEVEADWAFDFEILKPVLQARGYNTSGARGLCELPRVYCNYGFRRRAPSYSKILMGDWVGKEYQLILNIKNDSEPAVLDESLFNLRRVGYFDIAVNGGPMPPGIERLQRTSVIFLTGTGTRGIEGPLPARFWHFRTRMFSLTLMGSKFSGRLADELPFCEHLDHSLSLYLMPTFEGNVSGLHACNKITELVSIWDVPRLGGNAYTAVLGMKRIEGSIVMTANFSGQIPYAESSGEGGLDIWEQWCQANRTKRLGFAVKQAVNGPLPLGLKACADVFQSFYAFGSGLTGHFPINFSSSLAMDADGIYVEDNKFTGPIPDVPPQTTAVGLSKNRWSGDLPPSWSEAIGLTELRLLDCEMSGPLPNLTAQMKVVSLKGNRFVGRIPESWFPSNLTSIDLSGNQIIGPLFSWGWLGADPNGNFNGNEMLELYRATPPWPLKSLKLNDNPLGISAGFLMGMASYYELEELYVSNCSLHGFISEADVIPWKRGPGGDLALAGGAAFSSLKVLDLSHNPISSLGFGNAEASPGACWGKRWALHFPSLQKLYLQACTSLRRLAPAAYALQLLSILGATSLETPQIHPDTSACAALYGSPDLTCDLDKQVTCLYLNPLYSKADAAAKECGQLGAALESGERPTILVDESFRSETLCRCLPGFQLEEGGDACVQCGEGSYRSQGMRACQACPAESNTTGSSLATSVSDCECSAGFFMSDGICDMCPKNRFSAVAGVRSIQACAECPPGTVTAGQGASSSDDCVCPLGSTVQSPGSRVCVMCPQRTYKDRLGGGVCQACPVEVGTALTTQLAGATSALDCVCPRGTYSPADNGAQCLACPKGMLCDKANTSEAALPQFGSPEVGLPFPAAAPGFMTRVEEPMMPFRCKKTLWCPGGRPGTCALGRDSTAVGCGKCPEGTYTGTGGACIPCSDSAATVLVVLAVVGGMFALALLAFVVNKNTSSEPRSMTTILIMMALTITAVQSMGILATMSVAWVEPLSSIFKVLAMFSFDMEVLRTECILGQSVAKSYTLRQLVAPCATIYIALVILLKKKLYNPDLHYTAETLNAVGMGYQAFFVSILLSITLPFVCYSHPVEGRYSMVSNPSVLCFEGSEFATMVAMGAVSLLVSVVPFLGLVTYATCNYRRATGDSSRSHAHLTMFRFLFFRFKPEAYYYSCIALLRSLSVCLVPVIARDSAAVQIMGMSSIFLGSAVVQLHLQPWRSVAANLTDAVLSSMMVLLLNCAAMGTDFAQTASIVGLLGSVVVVLIFGGVLLLVGYNIYKRFVPTPFFQRFICHHKADAAAQARYLQLLFVQKTRDGCFLDSDHLSNLDDLLDLVRCSIGQLVVLLTSDTMRRPWCAAEITTVFQTHQKAVVVHTPSFVLPFAEEITADTMDGYVHASDVKLVELGITNTAISQAFEWILSEAVEAVMFQEKLFGLSRFQAVVDDVLKVRSRMSAAVPTTTKRRGNIPSSSSLTSVGSLTGSSLTKQQVLKPGMLVISSLPYNDEASAAAGIVASKIQEMVIGFVKAGICLLANVTDQSESQIFDAVDRAHALLVVLSLGSLTSPEQLKVILHSVSASVGLEAIPILTPSFRFPDSSFYDQELQGGAHGAEFAETLRSFFKHIAVLLATHASDQVLEAQCKDIVARVPRERRLTRRGSSDSAGLGGMPQALASRLVTSSRAQQQQPHAGDSPDSSSDRPSARVAAAGSASGRTNSPGLPQTDLSTAATTADRAASGAGSSSGGGGGSSGVDEENVDGALVHAI